MKHTPEPWKVRTAFTNGEPACLTIHTGMTSIADLYGMKAHDPKAEANAQRIVACVNACAGIQNPEKTVPELAKLIKEACAYISRLRDCGKYEAIDLLTNNPGEDMEDALKNIIRKL